MTAEKKQDLLLINLLLPTLKKREKTDKNNFPCGSKFKVILLSNTFWIKKR
jgi:hypothetical protein